MVALDPNRVDELVRVYRAHNEPLHDTLECCAGIDDVLADAEGRGTPARHRHREAPADRRPRVRAAADRALLRRRRRRRRDRAPQARPRAAAARARAPRRRAPTTPRTSATRRSTCRRPAPPASTRSASAGGASTTREALVDDADVVVDRRRNCLPSSESKRAAESARGRAARAAEPLAARVPRPRRPVRRRRDLRPALRRARRARTRASRACTRPTRRRTASARRLSGKFQKVRHLEPMGSLEKVTTEEALVKWADDRRQAARQRRPGRVRDRAEDRRARDQPHLRGRRLRRAARRAATVRSARTSRRTCARSPRSRCACSARARRRCSRCAARSTCRSRASAQLNERLVAEDKKPTPNPRNAAAGSLRQKNPSITACAPALASGRTASARATGVELASHSETLEWLRGHGFPINPFAERLETIEAVAKACRDWERKRAELDYEIDGIVIKVDDYAQQQRLGLRSTSGRAGRARSSGRR